MQAGLSRAPSLYLVTDRRRTAGRPLLEIVERALDGGADGVQLREKDLSGAELVRLATALRRLTERYGARLLVNDRIDVALAADADGVHLPQDGIPPAAARELLGPGRLIAVSTHSSTEVSAAVGGSADFVVFGPVYATPSKAAYGPPRGVRELAGAAAASRVPLLAIGGITRDRIDEVLGAGARGIAVISALLEADDPADAARELAARLGTRAPV
jgi:thiamine-phosphate pyrophosphorylase